MEAHLPMTSIDRFLMQRHYTALTVEYLVAESVPKLSAWVHSLAQWFSRPRIVQVNFAVCVCDTAYVPGP